MLRFATSTDADAIGDIHVESWRVAYEGIMPASVLAGMSKKERSALWKERVEKDPALVVVAGEGESIAGFVSFGPSRDPDSKGCGEIYALYVAPERWQLGFGSLLMGKAEEELWARGHQTITLWVLARNGRARDFYERSGYSADGTTKDIVVGGATLAEPRYAKPRPTGLA